MSDRPLALITGASRGIGRAIAVHLASRGWDPGINYLRNEEAARETAREVERAGGRAILLPGDVADDGVRERLLATIREDRGRLDALVNNAGISSPKRVDILDVDRESYDRVLDTNLRGPHFLSRDVARWMLEQGEAHPDRVFHIVNISSISEYTVSVHRSDYCLAKAAMGMLTRLYAQRLGPHRIQVNEIRPGIIETDMTSTVKEKYDRLIAEGLTPIPRWGRAEDVARAVGALLEGHLPFTTGAALDVDGGFHIRNL